MNIRTTLGAAAAALLLAGSPALAAGKDHQSRFEHYAGTATCLQCHQAEAESFFHSQHYQWLGSAEGLANDPGRPLGKMNMINDFCTNPVTSWIGEVKNEDGKVVASGCSGCHAGKGLLPSRTMNREQLENIDCLICHAEGYRRGVYRDEAGKWEWKPILWKNQEGLDSVSKRITSPTRAMCLRCHNAAGGGPNVKRGDMDYVLAKPTREFDVHMAADGKDMQCVACHAGGDHRVVGRGSDLAATDSPGQRLTCAGECHEAAPHTTGRLNRHAERIECTTCHVPKFARDQATEMSRDWSKVVFNAEKGKHGGAQVMATDVTPVYAWSNGASYMQLAGTRVSLTKAGEIMSAVPTGSRSDPKSKIAPFKLHRGVMPVTTDTGWLLPIAVEECFATGDVNDATRKAAKAFYGLDEVDFEWVPTIRYMSIAHGVPPAADALGCGDCHGADGRLDWQALGYDGDPRNAR